MEIISRFFSPILYGSGIYRCFYDKPDNLGNFIKSSSLLDLALQGVALYSFTNIVKSGVRF